MIAPDAPTLTARTDPCPGVEVYFPTLDDDVATITVLRTADGVTEAVAGALNATASGDYVVTDWQVPFGVTVTYVGQVFDSEGSSLLSAQSTIEVDTTDVWFQNSIDPSQSFTVELQTPDSAWALQRTTNNQQVFVAGLPRPFNQFWGQGALTGLQLQAMTDAGADTANFNGVTSWPQLLVRTPPIFETLPRLLYAAVGQASHQYPVNVEADALIVWLLTVDEVQPFSKAILRPLVTWDDWQAAFPADTATWDDVMAVYSAGTWTDAQRNPPSA